MIQKPLTYVKFNTLIDYAINVINFHLKPHDFSL